MKITGHLWCMDTIRDWKAATALEFLDGAMLAIEESIAWNRQSFGGTYCKVRVDISVRDGEQFARCPLCWVDMHWPHERIADTIEEAVGRIFN